MSNTNDVGLYQKKSGLWYFRYSITINGKKTTRKCSTDALGQPLRTQSAARKAREAAIAQAKLERSCKHPVKRCTVEELYTEYRANGCKGKAYSTIRKQDSLWENHFKKDFGKRFIDDISPAEAMDYLTKLYYEEGYTFKYVEGFLRMFYLIFGQAYTRNYIDIETYSRLCMNKGTKISMPPVKRDDDLDIVIFTKEEIAKLDNYFKGTTAETAYYLGRYCGLRINEAYGLKWDHVDFENGCIIIDRQMAYQDGLIKLVPVKTRNSNRTVYLCDFFLNYLKDLYSKRIEDEEKLREIIVQKQTLLKDIDGKLISSYLLVNSLPDGTIRTVNSMKFHKKKIDGLGITFKFHYLRHTYGTMMADMNTPEHLLLTQMGHSKIETTKMYYITNSESGIAILRNNVNNL